MSAYSPAAHCAFQIFGSGATPEAFALVLISGVWRIDSLTGATNVKSLFFNKKCQPYVANQSVEGVMNDKFN